VPTPLTSVPLSSRVVIAYELDENTILKLSLFGVTVALDEIFNVAENAANPIEILDITATKINIIVSCFFLLYFIPLLLFYLSILC
jgi:hypothetical protein